MWKSDKYICENETSTQVGYKWVARYGCKYNIQTQSVYKSLGNITKSTIGFYIIWKLENVENLKKKALPSTF